MEEPLQKNWHSLENDQIFQELQTSEQGLSEEQAQQRLQKFGKNIIQLQPTDNPLTIFMRQLNNPMIYILTVSTLLALLLGKYTDSIVVFSVVVLNTLIGFFQEYKAHRIMKNLESVIPFQTIVNRNKESKKIHPSELVPGDLVTLNPGDHIPADIRLISATDLECDESILTGESLPVSKDPQVLSNNTALTERKNMMFSGTYVTSGTGTGIAVATGENTEFGKVIKLIESVKTLETPLSITSKKIIKIITLAVISIAIALFFISYFRGSSFFQAIFGAVVLIVAAIPEGFPAVITIASSIGVQRMARRKVIVRQLPAIEALGSTNIICTDKTGTLTYNTMTVQKVWTSSGFSTMNGLEGEFQFENSHQKDEVIELFKSAILCSEAEVEDHLDETNFVGDPTEIALVIAGRKLGLHEDEIHEEKKQKDIIPFESQTRVMATLNTHDHQQFIFIKGAPEELLKKCNDQTNNNQIHTLIHEMAKEGLRLLAVAKKKVDPSLTQIEQNDLEKDFIFLGLIGMIDPPRKEVYEAIKSCHEAGIEIKMITGDHPLTAKAIAKQLGLQAEHILTGDEIENMEGHSWQEAVKNTEVFARVLPQDKLRLVKLLQENLNVVAVTGDGVNDAAALKRADVGIAMGKKGTAVAKEASDIILVDDNFLSIQAAIEEGRRVYDNLIKSLLFVLPTSLGQGLVVFLSMLFFPLHGKIPLHPMSPIQILWVNLVVAIALSLPLAFESPEPDIMQRPPRKKHAPVIDKFLIIKTCIVSTVIALDAIGLFLWVYYRDVTLGTLPFQAIAKAQTIAVTGILLVQVFYLFSCRSFKGSLFTIGFFSNPYIFLGIGGVLFAQICFIYAPFMQAIFHTSYLGLLEWAIATALAFVIVPITALEKFLQKKWGSSRF